MKAELDVFVSTGGLRLVKPDGKVLGSFPLQRIQEWSITSPGTFSLSVVNGEKVVGLVIHGDPDEVFAIIDCLERQVAQILEDMRAKEEGREAADVSSPPRRMRPEPVGERDPPASEPVAEMARRRDRSRRLRRARCGGGRTRPGGLRGGPARGPAAGDVPLRVRGRGGAFPAAAGEPALERASAVAGG